MVEGARVLITGLGAVTPAGPSVEEFWEALIEGRPGAGAIERFPTDDLTSHAGALVRGFNPRKFITPAKVRRLDLASRYAVAAARQAFEAAGHALPPAEADRVGSLIGSASAGATPVRDFLAPVLVQGPEASQPMLFPNTVGNAPSSYVAIELGLKGPNSTVCQKEASGALALGTAADFVREGRCDAMVAGGADELAESLYRAYAGLGVLAQAGELPEGSHPYREGSSGFLMGEGAYMLLLEAAPAWERRAPGRQAWAELEGWGMAGEPAHPYAWPADERCIVRSLRAALKDAGREPDEVDLVVSSANGVAQVEELEDRALAEVFGERIPPVTSVKTLTGEMGGSGAASVLAAAQVLREGHVFGVLGSHPRRAGLSARPVRRHVEVAARRILVSAVGSGGACGAIVLSRPED